ncbi:D-alanine--D-alanine ligase [Bienertia sinuspersici]
MVSDSAHGISGLLRSVTPKRAFEFGLEHSTLLKKLLELMMQRRGKFVVIRPK